MAIKTKGNTDIKPDQAGYRRVQSKGAYDQLNKGDGGKPYDPKTYPAYAAKRDALRAKNKKLGLGGHRGN